MQGVSFFFLAPSSANFPFSLPIPSAQIKVTVQGLFNLNQDIPAFKEHLRDFMVQIKVFNHSEGVIYNYVLICLIVCVCVCVCVCVN